MSSCPQFHADIMHNKQLNGCRSILFPSTQPNNDLKWAFVQGVISKLGLLGTVCTSVLDKACRLYAKHISSLYTCSYPLVCVLQSPTYTYG